MSRAGFVLGFVDFRAAQSLQDVASIVSETVFGGIPFGVKHQDYDDGPPTLILQRTFVGLVAELFGGPDHYTIEVGTVPSASVEGLPEVADVSAILKQQLERLQGISLLTTDI